MCHHIDMAIDWDAVVSEDHSDTPETARTDRPDTADVLDVDAAGRLEQHVEADPLTASPADD
jgi:hypothetical protein